MKDKNRSGAKWGEEGMWIPRGRNRINLDITPRVSPKAKNPMSMSIRVPLLFCCINSKEVKTNKRTTFDLRLMLWHIHTRLLTTQCSRKNINHPCNSNIYFSFLFLNTEYYSVIQEIYFRYSPWNREQNQEAEQLICIKGQILTANGLLVVLNQILLCSFTGLLTFSHYTAFWNGQTAYFH